MIQWTLLALFLLGGVSAPPPPSVLVVSIDGLPWRTWLAERDHLPTLRALTAGGTQLPLQTVFPSVTWPAHATFLTGSLPRQHGVVGNHLLQRPDQKPLELWQLPATALRVPTLFAAFAAAQRSTAAVMWPNTAGAPGLDWQIPEVYGQAAFARGTTPGLLGELAASGLPTTELGRLAADEAFLLDAFTRDAAVWLIQHKQPRLLLLHFLAVDTTAHTYGPDGRPPRWALRSIDALLADVLAAYATAGRAETLRVIVVSDHGFVALRTALDPATLAPPPLRRRVHSVANGQALFVYLDAVSPMETTALVAAWRRQPEIAEVVLPADFAALGLPAATQLPEMPDAILVARADVLWTARRGALTTLGMHGGQPADPQLRGVFLASAAVPMAGPRALVLATDVADLILQAGGLPGLATPPELPAVRR